MRERRPVAVIGCGNILMGDDGVGVRAVERLRQRDVPQGVDLIDAGTALLMDVLPFVGDVEKTVLVDVIRAGGEPGSVYRMPLAELEKRMKQPAPKYSLHDVELREALELARLSRAGLGEVVVVAMEPARLELGMELSRQAESAMPKLLGAIRSEIGNPEE